MTRKGRETGSVETRLINLFASMFFSVPTAVFTWIGANKQLSYWGRFSREWLFCRMPHPVWFAGTVFTHLFPSMTGVSWHRLLKYERWWGW